MDKTRFTRRILFMAAASALALAFAYAQKEYQMDTIKTSGGDLKITFVGHGTLMLEYAGKPSFMSIRSRCTRITRRCPRRTWS